MDKKDKPLKRLKRKIGVENLWLYLLSLMKDQREKYAYSLIRTIEERYGFNPGKVLPYIVFKKLEREGYVVSVRKGNRRYYKITDRGLELFSDGISFLENLISKLKKGV